MSVWPTGGIMIDGHKEIPLIPGFLSTGLMKAEAGNRKSFNLVDKWKIMIKMRTSEMAPQKNSTLKCSKINEEHPQD